jgi:predicted nucleic acid-binding protein
MIVLDTNVLLEMLKPVPDARVLAWFEVQPRPSMFTTAVTRGELLRGIRILPEGQRRQGLWEAAMKIFNDEFAGRILGYDSDAADQYAEIGAARRAAGRPISQFDAQIAAVTRSRGAAIATRNVKDFEDCGVDIINPWAT